MPFGNYKTLAEAMLGLQVFEAEEVFLERPPVSVSDYFRAELEGTMRDFDVACSESAICECLLFPILREALKPFHDVIGMWSHVALYQGDRLLGVPDYVIARRSPLSRSVMGQPFALIMEAKKNDFDAGWAQCLAAMRAAQTLNGEPGRLVYGAVSDGFVWRFGKLHADTFTRHPAIYDVYRLDVLFAALHHLLTLCKQQVLTPATAA